MKSTETVFRITEQSRCLGFQHCSLGRHRSTGSRGQRWLRVDLLTVSQPFHFLLSHLLVSFLVVEVTQHATVLCSDRVCGFTQAQKLTAVDAAEGAGRPLGVLPGVTGPTTSLPAVSQSLFEESSLLATASVCENDQHKGQTGSLAPPRLRGTSALPERPSGTVPMHPERPPPRSGTIFNVPQSRHTVGFRVDSCSCALSLLTP